MKDKKKIKDYDTFVKQWNMRVVTDKLVEEDCKQIQKEIWANRGTPVFTDDFCFRSVGMGKTLADLICKNDQERRLYMLGKFPERLPPQ